MANDIGGACSTYKRYEHCVESFISGKNDKSEWNLDNLYL
jgi:hypothetical protein